MYESLQLYGETLLEVAGGVAGFALLSTYIYAICQFVSGTLNELFSSVF